MIHIDSHPHQTETTHQKVQTIHFKHYLNIPHIQIQVQTYSSSSSHSPSAPYSPDRATITPNNTPQTQTPVMTTQPQNIITTQPQNILTIQPQSTSQNLSIFETKSPTSDSCDESLTNNNSVQDTSSILNRPPLPPIPTTRTIHIPDPSSVLQYINSYLNFPTKITKKLCSTLNKPNSYKNYTRKQSQLTIGIKFIHIFSIISKIRTPEINYYFVFNGFIL